VKLIGVILVAVVASWFAAVVQANIVIDTVPVGNPGNAGDTRYPSGGVSSFGGVAYAYNIGKYEVTTGQYTAFLNAVAATDTYGLYSTSMNTVNIYSGCNIRRSGSSGSYTYAVGTGTPTDVANWANRPVNMVSWGDSARFANWMHNGQPTGAQNLSTTEDGSYYLNGATSNAGLMAVTRKANATWAITSEDEWYKAAYHKNDGVTGNYWDYPTGTNAIPNNGNPGGDTGNSATFYDGDWTVGSPYWRTNAGAFGQSGSSYGTFDQGGNVWEWNEAVIGSYRGLRGGSFYHGGNVLHASGRDSSHHYNPSLEYDSVGFRLSEVPEPSTVAMLILGGSVMLSQRQRPRVDK
jgi:formylglycine-generating enzyme required for sulfatase activity